MAEHCGYVVRVEKLRPHSNADRLQIATFFGNDTCVGLDVAQGEIGIYFPSDLQLSEEFCDENHMCHTKADGTADTGYLERDKRNIKAIRLRGEKSDGIFVPIAAVAYTGVNLDKLNVGDKIEMLNGHEICCKYIPKANASKTVAGGAGKRVKRRAKRSIAPQFFEHADTEQLAYNLNAFKAGDEIEITLKMHGTSQRTGYVPVFKGYNDSKWQIFTNKLKTVFGMLGGKSMDEIRFTHGEPIYDWGYVSGTRRTVLEDFDGGFYGSNEFRKQHHDKFVGKLRKGETVYYEVVGFTHTGAPIMADGNNKKVGKDFVKQYGETTTFSYGCAPNGCKDGELMKFATNAAGDKLMSFTQFPQSDIYVYRMMMTNEDGDVVEYSPDFMRYRCEQMGIKTVPVWDRFTIPESTCMSGEEDEYGIFTSAGDYVLKEAEHFYDGPDPIGKTHVREGVVVRILNRPSFTAYKHKNYSFKVLEGIIKEDASAPDMEEAEELNE